MSATLRLLGSAALGLVLLTACADDHADRGDGGDHHTAADTPTSSAATSAASPTPTTSIEQPAEDPVGITLYDADFAVNASGELSVVEALTLDVSAAGRHGIYRRFDEGVEVEGFTATLDGRPTTIQDSTEDGKTVFRIGDPDRTLAVGEHSVRMEYHVGDVLTGDGAQGARFDWLLIPEGWTMDISATDLTVDLPAVATHAACTIGDVQPCDVTGVGTKRLEVVTGKLAGHPPVRLQVSMSGL